MRIIIVGDGKVGYTLAEQLSKENHDVVIIDRDDDALRRASDALDVMCVKGNGASGAVLREAGVDKCDMLIAATSGDEMNMVCCLTAKKLGARNTAARIRDPEYARDITMLKRELGINLVINPEQATAAEISRLLRFTGASNIEHFSRGRVELMRIVITESDPLCRVKLSSVRKRSLGNILFCAVERADDIFIPHGDTAFEVGDKVYVIGEPTGLSTFCKQQHIQTVRVKNMMIVGGGRIGRYLAVYMLKLGVSVRIVEIDPEICAQLQEEVPDALVILGDGTDQDLLNAEGLQQMDAFIALTGRDEDNLMVSLYAHQSGIAKVVAKATRQNYAALVRGMGLTSVVSPKHITAAQIVRYVRAIHNTGDTHLDAMYRIIEGQLDILEFSVGKSSPYVEIPLKNLPLNKNTLLAAIIRENRVIIPDGNDHLAIGDGVILVAHDQLLTNLEDAFHG